MIAARMQHTNGKGSWMVYKECDRKYAEQVTSEQKITERKKGKEIARWAPKTSNAANHYLDCEVYAAAANIKGVRALYLENVENKPEPKKAPERAPEPEED